MAAGAASSPKANGIHQTNTPVELAFDVPGSADLRINLHVSILATTVLLFLSSSSAESGPTAVPMGSFVYAMPDVSLTHGVGGLVV